MLPLNKALLRFTLSTCSWSDANACVTPYPAPDPEWKSDSKIWKYHSVGFSVLSKRRERKCTFSVTTWHFKPGAESPKYKHLKSPSKTFLPRCRHPNSQHNQAAVTASRPALFFSVSPAEGSDSRGEKANRAGLSGRGAEEDAITVLIEPRRTQTHKHLV